MLPSHLQASGSTDLAAIQLLEHPESYPGLRPLNAAESILRLSEVPAIECYPFSVWLLQMTATSALVRRVEWCRRRDQRFARAAPHTFGAEAELPREQVAALVEDLNRISIPPFLPVSPGIDGVIHTIEYGQEARTASISWWCSPEEWSELAAWYDRTRQFFEHHLPLSTAQDPQILPEIPSRPAGIRRPMLRGSHRPE